MKNYLIYGYKTSGQAVHELLKMQKNTQIFIYDEQYESGFVKKSQINSQFLHNLEAIIVSPAVPFEDEILQKAREIGTKVYSEVQFAYQNCASENIIGITGTNGKSTVTMLIAHILNSAKKTAYALGNIGQAFCQKIPQINSTDFISLELSSFQLESITTLRPHIACILNITPDHLDRHKDMQTYAKIKGNITKNQTSKDYLLLNADQTPIEYLPHTQADVRFISTHKPTNGAYVFEDTIYFAGISILPVQELPILGKHNQSNACFATAACFLSGLSAQQIAHGLKTFTPLAHRMQYLGQKNGQSFFDDSKATNEDSAIMSVQSMNGSTAVILGGSNKDTPFDKIFHTQNLHFAALIGHTARSLEHYAKQAEFANFKVCSSLSDAFFACINSGAKNVLLSPACASFDMFADYKQRGEAFAKLFEDYKNIN